MKLLDILKEQDDSHEMELNLRKAKSLFQVYKEGTVELYSYDDAIIGYKLSDVNYVENEYKNGLYIQVNRVDLYLNDIQLYNDVQKKDDIWEKENSYNFIVKVLSKIHSLFTQHDQWTDLRMFSPENIDMYHIHYVPPKD